MSIENKLNRLTQIKESQRASLGLGENIPWGDFADYAVKKSEYETLYNDYVALINQDYNVTYFLANVASSNENTNISPSSAYTTTLTATEGYELDSVTVTMGGTDITDDAYAEAQYDRGNVSISEVSGDVIVRAIAKPNVLEVTLNITNMTYLEVETPEFGTPYTVDFFVNEGYLFPSTVTVTMGGTTLVAGEDYGYVYDSTNGVLTVNNVSDDITITANAVIITYNVVSNVTNGTISHPDTVNYNSPLNSCTITPSTGYQLPSIINVAMAGVTLVQGTDYTYDSANGSVSIAQVIGNVVINAVCEIITYSVTKTLDSHLTGSNDTATVNHGDTYVLTLVPDTGYSLPPSITVTMGGNCVADAYDENSGIITISNVSGNIIINASAVINTYEVNTTLSNYTETTGSESVNHGSDYSATFTPDANFIFDNCTVMMNGIPVENAYTVDETNIVSITVTNVTGNISIVLNGKTYLTYIGTIESTQNAITIDDESLTSGNYTIKYVDLNGTPLEDWSEVYTFTK